MSDHINFYSKLKFTPAHIYLLCSLSLPVVPNEVVGHAELQDVFDKALLPAGKFQILPSIPPFSLLRLPSPELLTVCLTSLLLLLFLTLG